jgi:hypothetical protein
MLLALAAGVVCVAGYLAFEWWRSSSDNMVLLLLHSADPAQRKLGAWLTAEKAVRRGAEFIARQLELDREPAADVRESYVYALGSCGRSEHFHVVATLLATDANGYTRQTAWQTLARLDPERFGTLAASCPPAEDPWDQLGLACAWLRIGDVRGVPTLFRWAHDGNADQRLVAGRGLSKGVAPLLEVVGRWPLSAAVREGQVWPADLVAEVERRCAGLDLQHIADQSRLHLEAAHRLQRDAHRLTSARDWIARVLFSL